MVTPTHVPKVLDEKHPFIESSDDVTGYLAVYFYIQSINDSKFSQVITDKLLMATPHDIAAFRLSAKTSLDYYADRFIKHKEEIIKSEIYRSTYGDIMRVSYDRLLSDQQVGFEKIISSVEKSNSIWKQVLISFIASFAFGLIVTAITYIDNPFKNWSHKPTPAHTGEP